MTDRIVHEDEPARTPTAEAEEDIGDA